MINVTVAGGRRIFVAASVGLMLVGCASSASDIPTASISPLMYQSHSCDQLMMEAHRISSRVAELSGAQDKKATQDAIATGVAIVVFWPAAFLVGGNDHTAAELSRLKGELDAVERMSIQKNCNLQLRQERLPERGPPPERRERTY
jgi:hypothetical protein